MWFGQSFPCLWCLGVGFRWRHWDGAAVAEVYCRGRWVGAAALYYRIAASLCWPTSSLTLTRIGRPKKRGPLWARKGRSPQCRKGGPPAPSRSNDGRTTRAQRRLPASPAPAHKAGSQVRRTSRLSPWRPSARLRTASRRQRAMSINKPPLSHVG